MNKNDIKIYGISGPVVTVLGHTPLIMQEMVFVGNSRLIGEVINISKEKTTIQVYENTTGLKADEPVESTGFPIRAALAPGLLSNIYDGICRPLKDAEKISGHYIKTGMDLPSIDLNKKWEVTVLLKEGDTVLGGTIFAECQETPAIRNKATAPHDLKGKVKSAKKSGFYSVTETIIEVESENGEIIPLCMMQKWAIRKARPVTQRLEATTPLITGQRVIDTLFPIAKGGAAAIPGGFGTGKTMLQHQLAKWSDADLIVYVGCGERGNEMTQVLEEFGELTDPKTGGKMLERTVLIARYVLW